VTAALVLAVFASQAFAALTGGARLGAAYDLILAAEFDRANAELRAACPPAPAEACQTLATASLWWRILIEPENQSFDRALTAAAEAAIASTGAWTKREPQRGEAWFYAAAAYAPLVQWRVLRGHPIAAARDAKKIKDALETALRLDPTLDDAYFGIGMYHYYADIAPAYAKLLRRLLLLPGGDRDAGLREIERARERGAILRGEADFQRHLIDLWYEHEPRRALAILEALDRRYPSNPLFVERIADLHDRYLHDPRASAAAWRTLLSRAERSAVYDARAADTRARLGLAAQLIAMDAHADAIAQAQIVIDRNPPAAARARAEALLRIARTREPRRNF